MTGADSLLQRRLVHRTRGSRHGPITRLMSPSDLGGVVKPFVFLDLFQAEGGLMDMPVHPHSGIGTITVFTKGDVRFDEASNALPSLAHV
jgi:redox-sensitive bicupin YhaK (pirin superfamily)